MRKYFLSLALLSIFFASAFSQTKNYSLLIKKSERRLYLYQSDSLIKIYKIALGLAPVGRKEKQGDYKTPEGNYYISSKNNHSQFYLALGISYPNSEDARRGLEAGIITKSDYGKIISANKARRVSPQHTPLGGEIFIHGNGTSRDWTWGCVAMEDADVKELFDKIPLGTAIRILP